MPRTRHARGEASTAGKWNNQNRALIRRLAPCLVACACLLAGAPGLIRPLDSARIAVVFEPKEPYRTAVDAAVAAFRASGQEGTLFELPAADPAALATTLQRLADFKPTLVLTAGVTATERALESVTDAPVVFCMVPNALDARFVAPDAPTLPRVAGVASDIDPRAQVEWIAQTYPRARKVGVLHSERTARTAASLRDAGKKLGLDLLLISAKRDEFPQAINTLDQQQCDSVLMIPDAQVYNAPNVERLLLWGARQKKPVWAFSENIVKAGAFSGLYCDGAEVGRQAAATVLEVLRGKAPAEIGLQYPRVARRAVNVHTAAMIDASLDGKVFGGALRLGEEP
jgi:ABC-type uncharacterized transport system substrate-binding protein